MTSPAARDERDVARGEAVRRLSVRDVAGAAASLGEAERDDPSGEALLGVVQFLAERYDEAVTHFARALELRPGQPDWTAMLALARANARASVNVFVPELQFFDREVLLAAPPKPALPTPLDADPSAAWRELRFLIGHGVGTVASITWDTATRIVGRNYRGEVWTDWYHKPISKAILTLAYMRDQLFHDNLKSTYPPDVKAGFAAADLTQPDGVTHFRTADGSWNRLDNPKEGAAGTRFPRNVANSVIRRPTDEELLSPNPRTISRKLLTRGETMKEVPFLNLLAASWIQFMTHDWISHGEILQRDVIEIPLDEDDPARKLYHQRNIFVGRTQPDPTRREYGEPTPVTHINEVTHWWDGSQLYGSDQQTQDRLRSGVDGKLRLTDDNSLPCAENGVEDTGFVRNWWVGLSMLHTLFAREHNAICDRLKAGHPDWDDNRLFNVARLVNAAVMAKIHSIEWTPAILPNECLALALNSNWYGILTYKFRKPAHRKTVSEFKVANPELGGLVGNHINRHHVPFGLAEEFVEIYRLHSLLPEELRLRDSHSGDVIEELPVAATRQAASPKVTAAVGLANLFYSFGNQQPGQLVLNNFPKFMQELSIPGNPIFDMGAVDILRARERGVPRYNEFRRQLGLNPIRTFDDLTDDKAVVATIREVYGDNVENLDLMIGTLAEAHRPTHFGFGETMFQIFILNASRRLQSDRFYTDDYRAEVYSDEGLQWVDDSNFKIVILRHFPELASTGLANVTNAFEPWDTDAWLDPLRHPLREYDPDLKHEPWRGDAHR
jgi:Animal haem peroxidase